MGKQRLRAALAPPAQQEAGDERASAGGERERGRAGKDRAAHHLKEAKVWTSKVDLVYSVCTGTLSQVKRRTLLRCDSSAPPRPARSDARHTPPVHTRARPLHSSAIAHADLGQLRARSRRAAPRARFCAVRRPKPNMMLARRPSTLLRVAQRAGMPVRRMCTEAVEAPPGQPASQTSGERS